MSHQDDNPIDPNLSELYQSTSTEEPSAALDAAILAQAEAAVKPRRKRPTWLAPLGLAATLIVGVNLAVNLKDYSSAPDVYSTRTSSTPSTSVASPDEQLAEKSKIDANAREPLGQNNVNSARELRQITGLSNTPSGNSNQLVGELFGSEDMAHDTVENPVDDLADIETQEQSPISPRAINTEQLMSQQRSRETEQKKLENQLAREAVEQDLDVEVRKRPSSNPLVARRYAPPKVRRAPSLSDQSQSTSVASSASGVTATPSSPAPVAPSTSEPVTLTTAKETANEPVEHAGSRTRDEIEEVVVASDVPQSIDEAVDTPNSSQTIDEVTVAAEPSGAQIGKESAFSKYTNLDRPQAEHEQTPHDASATSALINSQLNETALNKLDQMGLPQCQFSTLAAKNRAIRQAKSEAALVTPPFDATTWKKYILKLQEQGRFQAACNHAEAYRLQFPDTPPK